MVDQIRFSAIERTESCSAGRMVCDAYCVDLELRYPERGTAPHNLSQQLSVTYGLHRVTFRVMLGGLDFIFDRYGDEPFSRAADISYQKSLENWGEGLVESPEATSEVYLAIEAHIRSEDFVSLAGKTRAVHDRERRRLLIDIDGGNGAGSWSRLADGVLASVIDGQLAGIFFDGFDFRED